MVVDGTFVLPIFSLAHQLYNDALVLINTYESYQNADQELKEAILQIRLYWTELRQNIDTLEDVWPSVDSNVQNLYEQALQTLYGKLQASITLTNRLVKDSDEKPSEGNFKTGETRRLDYALRMKGNLELSIQDLKKWRELYKISILLLSWSKDKELDSKLEGTLSRRREKDPVSTLKAIRAIINTTTGPSIQDSLQSVFCSLNEVSGQEEAIRYSHSQIWKNNLSGVQGLQGTLLVDEILEVAKKDLESVRNLARLLKLGNQFGILPCERVFKTDVGPLTQCRFAFIVPDSLDQPKSLREFLINGEKCSDLNEKFNIAKQLAKAVLFVHSAKFVHKNIRPEKILILKDKVSGFRSPFLIGFERFRLDNGQTRYQGDTVWEKNLYRHPDRQGERPESVYIMQHDIYSLGVCLLEIGTDRSFASYNQQNNTCVVCPALPELELVINSSQKEDQRARAFRIKKFLVELAETELPYKMGRKYTDIVVTCLTCLDKTGNRFGPQEDYYDQDGILLGVRYIEKIFFSLQEISV